ncbi:MAG: hypothetical protein HYZ49_18100 [Chloroflexi bacterium]|nr:hypothetical protein [Chloroflexota bacterium]
MQANHSRRRFFIIALAGLALAVLGVIRVRQWLLTPFGGEAAPTPTPATFTAASTAEPVAGFGVMGDSLSDEYRADNNRGEPYTATTLNWMEQLVLRRGLNFGEWGARDEPRRAGYEYNWARASATAHSLIESGQHLGLARQVANGEVSHVLMWVGANDFAIWNGTYKEIYDGALSDDALQAKVEGMIADITLAVDTVLAAGPVRMVVVTIPDISITPDTILTFPNQAGRQRAAGAIAEVNAAVVALADSRDIVVVDANGALAVLQPRFDKLGNIHIGGELINFFAKGNEPHNGRLDDVVGHPGTALSGLLANIVFVEPFDAHYGLNITLLSDNEILEDAGLRLAP